MSALRERLLFTDAWKVGPFFVFCSLTIALLVFLNSTQPFVLTQIFHSRRNGSASSMLALVDEVTALVLSPFWGALSDKIGTRYVAVCSLWIMLAALSLYPRVHSVVPALLITRGVFAMGASGAVAMVPAGLAELSMLVRGSSDPLARGSLEDGGDDDGFGQSDSHTHSQHAPLSRNASLSRNAAAEPFEHETNEDSVFHPGTGEALHDGDETVPLFETPDIDNEVFSAVAAAVRPNGVFAGMVGLWCGIGAVFAVSVLLPLVTRLSDGEGGDNESQVPGLRSVFAYVSLGGLLLSLVLLATMYQNPARGLRSLVLGSENVSIFDEAALDAGGSMMSYFELLKDGFLLAQNDRRLVVAYLGSMVARSASVVLALFVPLWVNQWYYSTGRCRLQDLPMGEDLPMGDEPGPAGCHEAIVQAAILTGLANTMVLLAAPFLGLAGDALGAVKVLRFSAILGVAATLTFTIVDTPLGLVPILGACLFGIAQVGCTTMSISMSTDKRRVAPGSVAGVYSLAGSAGILLVTQCGGNLADLWMKSPFVVMAAMFAFLVVACQQLAKRTVLRSMRSSVSL